MDVIRVIGKQVMSFKGNDGSDVTGVKLYFLENDDRVEGQKCGNFFLTSGRYDRIGYAPKVGDAVKVYYNRYGKPEFFELCEESF